MTRWPALAAAITALAVAGCGADPAVPDQLAPPAAPPTAALPADAPAPATPATADPAAPEPAAAPAEAAAPEPEGPISNAADARAVEQLVRDYYAAINRAQYEGDIAGLEALSTPDCNCRGVADMLKEMLALGRIEGARWELVSVDVQRVDRETASAVARLRVANGHVIGPDGAQAATVTNLGSSVTTLAITRSADGWRVAQTVH